MAGRPGRVEGAVIPLDTSGVAETAALVAAQTEMNGRSDGEAPGVVKRREAAWQSMATGLHVAQAKKRVLWEYHVKWPHRDHQNWPHPGPIG